MIDLRDDVRTTQARVDALPGDLAISIISQIELEAGLVGKNPSENSRRGRRLEALLSGMTVLPFGNLEAGAYRAILAVAGFSRRKIIDRVIAAQALVHRATLVTLNGPDFEDVPGLRLLAW